ncbi:unnamed protein product [Mytilus coruscus]|uniref:VLIG-type G domain-containing protein n=1 Tax=Mytilus coruscus TaxID=42192 RepID=A0A6J8EKN1_MYTCO|nr:unnamed protein product [Mytilus coruscus]
MASNMMSIDDREELTSDVDAISLDSEYYDALEEDEDSGILSDKEIWEISTQIGLDWFPIGITLGYKHCMMETLEDMYTKQPTRRNFCMIASWCKVVSNLQLKAKMQLASHFAKSNRKDIAEHIGVYYKNVHTPEAVYKQIQQITFDKSTGAQLRVCNHYSLEDMVVVVINQFKFDINVPEFRQMPRSMDQSIKELSGGPERRSLQWRKEEKNLTIVLSFEALTVKYMYCKVFIPDPNYTKDSSVFSFDSMEQALPTNRKPTLKNEFSRLLKDLSLTKFYPSKITLQDVRSIKSQDLPITERSIPWLMLSKIIMLNFKAREEDLSLFYERNAEEPVPEPYDSEDDLFEEDEVSPQINPMDMFYVTFLSCDMMLKQEIVSKLFACRLAVPILFRDINRKLVLTKWGLRKILLNKQIENKSLQMDALHCKTKRVSFIRIGQQTLSKSKLLNEIMCDQYHPTFFNRDCRLGASKRRVASGLVESSWFVSSGPGDEFGEHIMFMNLRGESIEYREEVAILCKLTNLLIVHTDILQLDSPNVREMLRTIHQNKIQVLYALESNDNPSVQPNKIYRDYRNHVAEFKSFIRFFDLKSVQQARSASDITKGLRKTIKEMISETQASSFEAKTNNLTISDENMSTVFTACYKKAVQVVRLIDNNPSFQKHDLLPLQGQLWQEYCTALKTLHRSKSNDEKPILKSQMQQSRLQQYRIYQDKMHPFVYVFLNHLQDLHKHNLEQMYCYLAWIKNFLDEKSRNILPQLISDYHESWVKMKTANEKKYPHEYERLKYLVAEQERKLVDASFGLEHLFREMGQIYEAVIKQSFFWKSKSVRQFPQIMSLLLQNGHVFEIMDGDTAMVPLIWVKAVFEQLKRDIGDKKLLAISVLGIQSSGKSTLLNAMFGLEFPVSAGRCTRGVFVQLVRVSKGILPFAYVLVIDTEGLRAPELADKKHSHDNELATFVLGLGNITIINIKGENTAEMEDVLQIAVHAFLRLKMANGKLKLQQTCIFVHQNVPAIDAKTAMTHSRQTMMDKLDKLTCEAASHEGLADITSFSQVIEVNLQTHMWYFSDLWFGDPPMAPVNLGYSGKVSDVKKHILYDIAQQKRMFLSITETMSRIEDLWNGILSDDFVFCFRNSLELKAYHSLESTFHYLIWKADKKIYEFFQSNVRVRIARCVDDNELENEATEVISILQKEMTEMQTLCNDQLNNFIESNSHREMMEQWRQSKSIQLGEHVTELIRKGIKDIQTTKTLRAAELMRTNKRKVHELELQEQAQALASQFKGQELSFQILIETFNSMWKKCFGPIEQDITHHIKSVQKEVEKILFELFAAERPLLQKELDTVSVQTQILKYNRKKKLKHSFSERTLSDGDISISKNANRGAVTDIQTCKQQATGIINVIFAKIDSYISNVRSVDIPFEKTLVTTVFMYLTDTINEHNKGIGELTNFKLTAALKVKMAVHIAKHITHVFNFMNDRYEKKHNIKAQMEDYRTLSWEQFRLSVEKKSDGIVMTNLLINTVQKLIEQEIEKRLPTEVEKTIIDECFSTKYSLMLSIMKTLAENDDFHDFYWYVTDAETYARDWITKFTNDKIFNKSSDKSTKYSRVISKLIEEYIVVIQDCLDFASNTTIKRSNQTNISFWTSTFEQTLGGQLPVPYDTFSFMRELLVYDCVFVSKHFKGQIKDLTKKLEQTFSQKSSRDVLWKGKNPYNSIFDKLWGCNERCPFCRETCQKTSKNHSEEQHTCVQHRPPGLKGVCKIETNSMSWEPCNYKVYSDHQFFCGVSDGKCQASGRCHTTGPQGAVHLYREYGKLIPDWEIEPSTLTNTSCYWMWFVYTYRKKLEKTYGYKVPEVINAWKSITKEQAIRSLKMRGTLSMDN